MFIYAALRPAQAVAEARRPLPDTVAEAAQRVAQLKREAAEAEAKLQRLLPAHLPPPPVMHSVTRGCCRSRMSSRSAGCSLRTFRHAIPLHLMPPAGLPSSSFPLHLGLVNPPSSYPCLLTS